MASIVDVILLLIIIFLLLVIVARIWNAGSPISGILALLANAITSQLHNYLNSVSTGNSTAQAGNRTYINVSTVPVVSESQLANYTLSLINKDRESYGLAPVALASEGSAQQHADSMLGQDYFSHWDLTGEKPYMRYTLMGGLGAVTENVAYITSKVCSLGVCAGNVDPSASIAAMENSMMYNDSICCDNGHRDNILDPNHNEVSIGVAYNSSSIYLVEDFIDDYITWNGTTPSYSTNGEVLLNGSLDAGYSISQIYVDYDAPLQSYTPSTVPQGPYGYGQEIAGVVTNPLYYYPNIQTIDANIHSASGTRFNTGFSMGSLVGKYGAGEYTVVLVLNSTTNSTGFVGSTYTIYINSNGQEYLPGTV